MRTLTLGLTLHSIATAVRAASGYVIDFATLTASQLQSRFGWVRTGAGTMIDSGGTVRYGAHNLLLNSATLATQTVTTVSGQQYTLSIYGTGSVALSGGASGTLAGTGVGDRVSLTVTASTTSITFTVTGSATSAQLNLGPTALDYIPTTTAPIFLTRAQDYTFGVPGLLLEGARTQLIQSGAIGAQMATQTKTVTAVAHTISFFGTGSVVLSGAHSATVNGSGATTLTSLTFTPSAGSLTMTVSGTVTDGQLEVGSYATSRIPNSTTGTMDRAADVAEIGPGSEFDALFGVPTYGPELVTNGTFDTDTTGWSVIGGASLSVASGRLRVTSNGTLSRARQSITVVAGKRYELAFFADKGTSTNYLVTAGSSSGGSDYVNLSAPDGAISRTVLATTTTLFIDVWCGTTTNGLYSEYDNISVREVIRQGTLVVAWCDLGATDGDIIALHNGTANEVISLYYTGGSVAVLCKAGGSNQLAATLGTPTVGALNKAAISWGAGGVAAVLNGGTVQANASGTVPAPTSARFIGTAIASASSAAWKPTRTTTLADQRTGAALQALTT